MTSPTPKPIEASMRKLIIPWAAVALLLVMVMVQEASLARLRGELRDGDVLLVKAGEVLEKQNATIKDQDEAIAKMQSTMELQQDVLMKQNRLIVQYRLAGGSGTIQ